MQLLIGQAMVLVLLALVHIGFEAYTLKQEASVGRLPTSRIVAENIPEAEHMQSTPEQSPVVLGTQSIPQPSPTPALQKSSFVIALTGDSMVETLGTGVDSLRSALKEKYPDVRFFLYNYAKGARTVSDNLKDIHEPYNYKDRHYPALDTLKPDIIIVGSSAYNIFDPHDTNRHWIDYTRLVQEAQTITPHVYILAEPAPLGSGFGINDSGVVWEPQNAWIHTSHITDQLKNVLGLSRTLNIPVVDAYTDSLDSQGQRGRRELIDSTDNIHLSEEGKAFMARKIVETLNFEPIR